MLHDLLFALHGHLGTIFKENSDGEVGVVPGLPFLSPSEESSLNRLLKLATRVISIKKFVEVHKRTLHSSGSENHPDGLLHGLYLSAFCDGVSVVLEPYTKTLLDVEKDILSDPLLTYMHILTAVEHYHLLFDAIDSLINTIRNRKNHGCQILTTVYGIAQTGNKLVQGSMHKILQKLHVVLYNQLAAWLLHGLLIDRHKEFFICKQDKKVDDSLSIFQEQSVSTLDSQMDTFHIRAEMLPSYIPSREADIILFVGTSLHLFENDVHKVDSLSLQSNVHVALRHLPNRDSHRDRIEEKRQEFRVEFLSLQKQEIFSLEKLQASLDKIRSTVAKDLWDICVVQANLESHLTMLKDFFLLGFGELYMVFLEEVSHVMRRAVSKMTEYDVNRAFRQSAVRVQLEEDDSALQNFHLTIAKTPKEDTSISYPIDAGYVMDSDDTWSLLGMTFNVKWPLHIIFTPSILSKYNKLFRFLLRVRRTQLALQNLWALQMSSSKFSLIHSDDDADLKRNVSNLTLRMHMSHLVDSLQYYLQADVLESHFSNLLAKIQDPSFTDFDQIIIAHDQYLTALLAQCFILSTPVFRSLIDVLNICQQFCEVVTASIQAGTMVAREVISQRVDQLSKDFGRQSSLLFHTLSAVCNQQSNPHLAQFLLLLDYNKYYTQNL